ncbi:hypothetical protein Ppa06_56470 [Planomonospora parontospora subsp. parontospora]|uniref:Uncharacterized protein n=2 Tax=Planomonospora parontospora TaxID=58119 RepID=A0AA37BN77_9ACTN|nr:hypothetical protein GCM10010126_65370 [Planomonospora parontospora]GII11849.1 hypothetical protein Ppa06_56470 [Planomonospora parontospora subsp. parontospora]
MNPACPGRTRAAGDYDGWVAYITRTAGVLGALTLILLTGCASERRQDDDAPELRALTVAEEVSSVVRSEDRHDGYVVNWAGVLANPNPWHFGEHVVVTVVGLDARGKEVVRMEQPLDAVPPAGSLAFTGQALAVKKPAKVTIGYRPAEWRRAGRIVSAFKPFPVSGVRTGRPKDGGYLVTGYVGTPYRLPAGTLAVTALLRDSAGRLLGGGTTFVDDVRENRRRRFLLDIESVADPGEVAGAEVVARTWGSSSRPYEELALGGAVPVHTVKPTTSPFEEDRGRRALPGETATP